MKDKEYTTVVLDKETKHEIFSNLCITLNTNKIDYVCSFNSDDCIKEIKCGEFIISNTLIITTTLLFLLTNKNNLALGFYDTKYLLKALRGDL